MNTNNESCKENTAWLNTYLTGGFLFKKAKYKVTYNKHGMKYLNSAM